MLCRICDNVAEHIFYSAPRSILAITRPVDVAINVYACRRCGHAQSEDIDFEKFYDREYQFQLESQDHDELHAVVNGHKIYRTDLQADIAQRLVSLKKNAKVLDYGAAKGRTLSKIYSTRPDLEPYLFDVSSDYAPLWSEWLDAGHQATYQIPKEWAGRFDAAFCFFVLEHVQKPTAVLREIADLLIADGLLFLTVPNPLENYSDFTVLEHVSHFTRGSLSAALAKNGFKIEQYSADVFFGAHVVVARKVGESEARGVATEDSVEDWKHLKDIADFWTKAERKLKQVASDGSGRPSAIYGASVYGSYIATRLEGRAEIRCFVDRNEHLWGESRFGIPIVGPSELPEDVTRIYAGVNPLKARSILKDVPEWRGREMEIIFLEGT